MASSTQAHYLIGRHTELAILRDALDRANSGEGSVVLLRGDAGIGKTHIARTLSNIATAQGALVLEGRSLEEAGTPAYWPWVQILRRFANDHDDSHLLEALGSDASCIAEICPDLISRLPGLNPPLPLSNPAQARFRLFDAVAQFWRRACATRVCLLIFEDLHWADAPSLRLLEFVAGELRRCRLLLVATLRNAEAPAHDALAPMLHELRRTTLLRPVPLSGLTVPETQRLIAQTSGCAASERAAAFVQEKTEGNPLFVIEMTRHFVIEDLLTQEIAVPASQYAHPTWRLPESISVVIGRRLARLSPEAIQTLRGAAVIGREFGIDLLRQVTEGLSKGKTLTALEEAREACVIDAMQEPGHFQFCHVLMRDVLYAQIPAPERMHAHLRAGTALERSHHEQLAPYLPAIAAHFYAALPNGPSDKAIRYATLTARLAQERLAYEEAVRWFHLALSALRQSVPVDGALRCELLIALGSAQAKAGDAAGALETLTEAASWADAAGKAHALAEAAIQFEEVSWRLGLAAREAVQLLKKALGSLADAERAIRARVQSALVRATVFAGAPNMARALRDKTVQLARKLGDAAVIELALRSGFWLPWDPSYLRGMLAEADEAIELARELPSRERMLDATVFRLHIRLTLGDLPGFSVDLTHFVELAGELRQPFHEYHGILLCAAQALLFGRLADAERFARAAVKIGSRLPGLDASGAYGMQMFALARERGELQSLAPVVRQFMQATPQSAVWRPALALVLAEVGQIPEARDELAQLAANHFASVARDSFWLTCMVYLAEVCAAVCDAERAEQLYPMLAPWKGYNVVAASATVCLGPTDHYLGMLSTVMRRWQDAERHLEAAIAMNQRQGAVPWLAHSQYRYLCMLLERNHPCDLPRARTLWEATSRLAEDLGMVTLTQRLQSLQSALGDRRPAPPNPGGLSRREAQVLRMVANGKSNHEIAAAIFRSPNTVANHVRSILAKLGVANRTEAASVAARNGLL